MELGKSRERVYFGWSLGEGKQMNLTNTSILLSRKIFIDYICTLLYLDVSGYI